jgi:hypothetical protein
VESQRTDEAARRKALDASLSPRPSTPPTTDLPESQRGTIAAAERAKPPPAEKKGQGAEQKGSGKQEGGTATASGGSTAKKPSGS